MNIRTISKPVHPHKKWVVFPTENQLLQSVHNDGRLGDNLSEYLDIQGEYIGYLLKSFLKRGLVKRQWPRRYRLTKNGRDRLLRRNHEVSRVFHWS